MMIKKELKMTTITAYAHQYLQGYTDTPVGVLDSAEFRAEVSRLAGPVTPRSAGALKQVAKSIKAVEKHLASLRGPRGGLPKTGLTEYRYHVRVLEQLKQELQ
jgi:hypothetical protein